MKKYLLFLVALLMVTGTARAQRGLNCSAVFKGKIVPTNKMIETEVRGSRISTYKLDYYHCVQFQTDETTTRKVAGLVSSDAAARSAEIENTGEILTYALIQPKPFRKANRYLCYQARPVGHGWIITLLYLEGSATLDELRNMFEKQ